MASVSSPDICIIGAGAGGLAAAEAAKGYGATVAVVEADRMGGNRLHLGSVPSKAFAAAAARAHALRTAGAFGVTPDDPRVNFGRIHDHIQQVIAALAPQDSVERLTALGIEVIKAEARFVDRRTLRAGDRMIRARRFIVATGSRPAPIEIAGLSDVTAFTAETIFENTRRPGHLVVVGGGATALELAQAHRRLGSEVTVLPQGPILPGVDPELADVLVSRLREEGVAFRGTLRPVSVTPRGAGVALEVREAGEEKSGEEGVGEPATINASHLLLLGARLPVLDTLDLEKAGVALDMARPGHLHLGRDLRTTNRRVHAIGEAAGAISVHEAVHQAHAVVRNALFGYRAGVGPVLARVVYTDPELAEAGLGEPSAEAARYRVVRASFAENDRARATRETCGLAKVIAERGGRIVGAGIVGPAAGELVAILSLAIARNLTVPDLGSFVAPHPSLAEIVNRLADGWAADQRPSPWLDRRLRLQRMLP